MFLSVRDHLHFGFMAMNVINAIDPTFGPGYDEAVVPTEKNESFCFIGL